MKVRKIEEQLLLLSLLYAFFDSKGLFLFSLRNEYVPSLVSLFLFYIFRFVINKIILTIYYHTLQFIFTEMTGVSDHIYSLIVQFNFTIYFYKLILHLYFDNNLI